MDPNTLDYECTASYGDDLLYGLCSHLRYLSIRGLCFKLLALICALGSGLSIGIECLVFHILDDFCNLGSLITGT